MPVIATAHGESFVSFNGVRSSGPALVLVHGAGGQHADWPIEWRGGIAAAAPLGVTASRDPRWLCGIPVYAIDLPGHGRSGGEASSDVQSYARAVADVIAAASIQRAVVAGHSMGGAIALELAADPELSRRLAGLVIIGSAAKLAVTEQILAGLKSDFAATVDMIVKFSWHRDAAEFYRSIGRRRMRDAGAAVVHADFLACSRYDMSGRLGDVAVPALVVAGDADKMVPPGASKALADGLSNARFEVVAGAGHFLHVEKTDAVAPLVSAFVAGL